MAGLPKFDPPLMLLAFDPQSDERSPWVTTCQHYFHNGAFNLDVPAGFRCDLATVPGFMLWLFGPNGKHQRAALFHDAGYRQQPTSQRSTIDEAFRVIMLTDGVPYWKAWLMWIAVRAFGGKSWDEYKRCNADARLAEEDS